MTVPNDNISALWFDAPLDPCVKILSVESGADYFDAIALGNEIISKDGFYAEGGATNVARRDGMGTTFLSAVECIGQIPDYYFQSVGSGTGAIAAYEANLRFIEDGRFGNKITKHVLSQNYPFTIMTRSWEASSRELLDYDTTQAREDAATIDAKVLSNRKPPYSVAGGLFDSLTATNGEMVNVTNDGIRQAQQLFLETEGVDALSAAGVAIKSLIDYAESGKLDKDAIIMLNVTGGGEDLFKKDKEIFYAKPTHVFPIDFTSEDVESVIAKLF